MVLTDMFPEQQIKRSASNARQDLKRFVRNIVPEHYGLSNEGNKKDNKDLARKLLANSAFMYKVRFTLSHSQH